MSDDSTLDLQESADNDEIIFDSVGSFDGMQFGVLVRVPEQRELSEDLLYRECFECAIRTWAIASTI